MWIDAIEIPDDMVFIKDKEARDMYKMWNGLRVVNTSLTKLLSVVAEDGSRQALQKENKNSQPRCNHAKVIIMEKRESWIKGMGTRGSGLRRLGLLNISSRMGCFHHTSPSPRPLK